MKFNEASVLVPAGQDLPPGARLWEAEAEDGGTIRIGINQTPEGVRLIQIGYEAEEQADPKLKGMGDRWPNYEEIEAALAAALEPKVIVGLHITTHDNAGRNIPPGAARILMLVEIGRAQGWAPPEIQIVQ